MRRPHTQSRTEARTPALMVLAAVTIVVLTAAACGGSSLPGSPADQANALVTAGLRAQLGGDLGTAQGDYQQAVGLNGNNKYAHYDLGTTYDAQGNHTQAVAEYKTAIAIDPNFVGALYNLGVDTAGTDPALAEQLYQKVVTLSPNDAAGWLNLGFVLIGMGQASAARVDWAKAVALDPTLASRIPSMTPSPASNPSATPG